MGLQHRLLSGFFIALLPFAGGCSRIWHDYHEPQGHDGPMVDVLIYGDWNSDFPKRSKKEVYVRFSDNAWGDWTTIRRYDIDSCDLNWEGHWQSPNAVEISFFDYGAGVWRTYNDDVDREIPHRLIKLVSFARQPDNSWKEVPGTQATAR